MLGRTGRSSPFSACKLDPWVLLIPSTFPAGGRKRRWCSASPGRLAEYSKFMKRLAARQGPLERSAEL